MIDPKTLVNVQHGYINEATNLVEKDILGVSKVNDLNPDYDSEEWRL